MKHKFIKLCRWIRNLKYRQKILLVCLASGLIPLAVVCVFSYNGGREVLKEQEYDSLKDSMNQVANSLGNQADIIENLIDYYVFDPELRSIVGQPQGTDYDTYDKYVNVVDPMMASPKYYHEEINRLTIFSDQISVAHDTTLAPLSDLQSEVWSSTVFNSNSVSWIWTGEDRDELLAIKRFPGNMVGQVYLGVFCNLSCIEKIADSFQRDGAGILLLDEDDRIFYANSGEGTDVSDLTIDQVREEFVCLETSPEDLPFSVCIYMDDMATYTRFRNLNRKILLTGSLCLLVILIFSANVSYFLVRRIKGLSDAVEHLDISATEVRFEDDSNDEVGVLTRKFADSVEEIQTLVNEVYKSKISQQDLEMKALQAQINPHFLYNSLSLINWMAIAAGEDDISGITLSLSDYYRTTLNKGDNFISVRGEILNIQSYINIQLMMHDNEFRVVYDLKEGLEDYQMPKLILQPLVENALEHGLDVKEDPDKEIRIQCLDDERDIIWIVSDNGVGMDAETLNDLTQKHEGGYGVRNVFERLTLLYGAEYGLKISSRPGEGTTVCIRIPKEWER